MLVNLLVSIWKLQWLSQLSPCEKVVFIIKDDQTEKSVDKPYNRKQIIVKQNIFLITNESATIQFIIKLQNRKSEIVEYGKASIDIKYFSQKLGLTPLKLIVQTTTSVKLCKIYVDLEVVKNSETKPKTQYKNERLVCFNFDKIKIEVSAKYLNELVSMFDLSAKSESSQKESEEIIIKHNQIASKKLMLIVKNNNSLKKTKMKLRSKKIGTKFILYCWIDQISQQSQFPVYMKLELKDFETNENVGFISFTVTLSNHISEQQYHKIKGNITLYSLLIQIEDKLFHGSAKLKITYGKQIKFGFMTIKSQQNAWMQTCVFKRQNLQNQLRFQLSSIKQHHLAMGGIFLNPFLDGTRYCNKQVDLYAKNKKIGQVKIDFQFEQQKKLILPQIK